MNNNVGYVFVFETHDKHGIDERDAHVLRAALEKRFPRRDFTSGIVNGILGVRAAQQDTVAMTFGDFLSEYQLFAEGFMASRYLWER